MPWKALTRGFAAYGRAMGSMTNFILLSLAYFLILGPTALIFRWTQSRKNKSGLPQGSAWRIKPEAGKDKAAWLKPY